MSIGMVGSIDFIELVVVETGLKTKRHSAFGVRFSVFGFRGAGRFNCGLQISDFGLGGAARGAGRAAQKGIAHDWYGKA